MLQEEQRLYGALYALRLLTRKYEFRDAEERVPLDHIVKTMFPTLLQVFKVCSKQLLIVYHLQAYCLSLLAAVIAVPRR